MISIMNLPPRSGVNNLILTPDYGPYVRLVPVITSASLRPERPLTEDICVLEKCLKCVKACPARALENSVCDASEEWLINKEKCYENMHNVSGGDVCGLCIKACPITRPQDPRSKPNDRMSSRIENMTRDQC
jgi:epoxyqueuosine reductase QueG